MLFMIAGRNSVEDTLFTYATGTWYSHVDNTFSPLFFNEDLTVFFTDPVERLEAVRLCYRSDADEDPLPKPRAPCYYDFFVTKDRNIANGTLTAETGYEQVQQILGGSMYT